MDCRSWELGTFATLFSGGEGWGVGAIAAGLRPLWDIEHDAEIAAVANRNLGSHVHIADILETDPQALESPEFLHASPPCPNFSNAKQGARESEHDIALGQATARFIEALLPRVFTLENVWLYRRSTSWEIIRDILNRCGYWFDLAHANAADFGVPQTRKRMIVRAVKGGMVPYLPAPEPWRGWYEAIEDLIPELPESQFAPWQLARLDDTLRETVLLSQGISRDQDNNEYGVPMRTKEDPAFAVTANSNQNAIRAFLVSNAKTEYGDGIREGDRPALSVTPQHAGRLRACLITGQYGSPSGTEDRQPHLRLAEEPANTVTASNRGDWRAFMVDGANAGRPPTVRMENEPMFTVDATRLTKHPKTAYVSGRVVKIDVRCLARWQTFPDSYELPEKSTLASRVIGNAVPCLLAEKLLRQLR